MADLFRTTKAGEERAFLTGLFQERAEMDPDATVAFLCNQMTLTDLHAAAKAAGMDLTEEDDDADDDEADDADAAAGPADPE
jgi:hypothetical protein